MRRKPSHAARRILASEQFRCPLASLPAAFPCSSSLSPFPFWSSLLLFLRLHLLQQAIQPLKAFVPETPEILKPFARIAKRLRNQTPRPALRLPSAGNQPGLLEHFQMLRDCRLAHRERARQFAYGRLAGCKPRKNRPASWIRKGREGGVKIDGRFHYRMVL